MKTEKLAVKFTLLDLAEIIKLADADNTTATSALQKAISRSAYIQEKQDQGCVILLKYPDGRINQVDNL
jgi:hypothetical protein